MKSVLLTAVASLLVLATGCSAGAQCDAVCESVNACEVSPTRPNKTDCPEYCNDVALTNERWGACEAEFNAHLSCWETNSSQVCSANFTGCENSATAWTDCMAHYCDAHPDDQSCTCAEFDVDDVATEDVDESENCIAYQGVFLTF